MARKITVHSSIREAIKHSITMEIECAGWGLFERGRQEILEKIRELEERVMAKIEESAKREGERAMRAIDEAITAAKLKGKLGKGGPI